MPRKGREDAMATRQDSTTQAAPAAGLAAQLQAGDQRALARALSWVENDHPLKEALLARCPPSQGTAYRVGITGPPGAGKSTLINGLIAQGRAQGWRVAVVAVDPTSPFTGGAVLGDRIRMASHTLDPDVFIRSMGARGGSGGLAGAVWEVLQLVEAAGYQLLLVETVGTGQSEWAVAQVVDTTVLVLTPASGDGIQAIKAGLMEVADLYLLNKADLPGAHQALAELRASLPPASPQSWQPPVLPVVATQGEGLADVWEAILAHRRALEAGGQGQAAPLAPARHPPVHQAETQRPPRPPRRVPVTLPRPRPPHSPRREVLVWPRVPKGTQKANRAHHPGGGGGDHSRRRLAASGRGGRAQDLRPRVSAGRGGGVFPLGGRAARMGERQRPEACGGGG
ncbi:MAG: methylmalonyl Co-A mutase-associated GTPase MeaB, partial [Firmicutes bacterium]|nr:methylmalonyl Co-A mutase-associated GTPase MeaB [Bacillota bacterium]